MNRIILLLSIFFLNAQVKAQEINIYAYDDPGPEYENIAGTVVEAIDGSFEKFWISSVTESIFEFRIERAKIEEVEGVEDFLVFGETEIIVSAYPAALVSPDDPFVTPDSHTLGGEEFGYLAAHYIDNDLPGCSQYRYYIINDSDERLDSIDVRFCSTVSLSENTKTLFTLYPNPTTDWVSIQWDSNSTQNYNLSITDLAGRMVYESDQIPADLDLSNLEKGLYIVQAVDSKTKERVYEQKLTLQ